MIVGSLQRAQEASENGLVLRLGRSGDAHAASNTAEEKGLEREAGDTKVTEPA